MGITTQEVSSDVKTIIAVLAITAGAAQATCLPDKFVRAKLASLQETVKDKAEIRGVFVQLWASPQGGWTLTATADATTCVLQYGKAYKGQSINTHFFPAA